MARSINEQLTSDLKDAMRAGDGPKRDVIRLLRSAIKNHEIERRSAATDDDVIHVIQAEIKQRRDSIAAYCAGGRDDLAQKEADELDIIEDYLPADLKPLSDQQLQEIVIVTAQELEVSGPADMRVLMPALVKATEGRADNRLLSKYATEELQRRAAQES